MISFNYTHGTKREEVSSNIVETSFYNLKSKAAGPRRYSFRATVYKWTNPEGQVAFVGEMQARLNGERYQSSKDALAPGASGHPSRYFETAEAAAAALDKMIVGSLKRYAKLAQDPANKIMNGLIP